MRPAAQKENAIPIRTHFNRKINFIEVVMSRNIISPEREESMRECWSKKVPVSQFQMFNQVNPGADSQNLGHNLP